MQCMHIIEIAWNPRHASKLVVASELMEIGRFLGPQVEWKFLD